MHYVKHNAGRSKRFQSSAVLNVALASLMLQLMSLGFCQKHEKYNVIIVVLVSQNHNEKTNFASHLISSEAFPELQNSLRCAQYSAVVEIWNGIGRIYSHPKMIFMHQ